MRVRGSSLSDNHRARANVSSSSVVKARTTSIAGDSWENAKSDERRASHFKMCLVTSVVEPVVGCECAMEQPLPCRSTPMTEISRWFMM